MRGSCAAILTDPLDKKKSDLACTGIMLLTRIYKALLLQSTPFEVGPFVRSRGLPYLLERHWCWALVSCNEVAPSDEKRGSYITRTRCSQFNAPPDDHSVLTGAADKSLSAARYREAGYNPCPQNRSCICSRGELVTGAL